MTKTQKHTPGPWKLHTGLDYIAIDAGNGREILADLVWPVYEEEEMANARLIAAAPELLEALKLAHRMIGTHGLREVSMHTLSEGGQCLEALEAAIAKAEGN